MSSSSIAFQTAVLTESPQVLPELAVQPSEGASAAS